ncbi:MAG: glycosyltransferase family 4 protein [Bacteroidota bacterium]
MNILQLCNKPPYPPLEGGSMAMHAMTQGLIDKGHQVKVLAVSSFKNRASAESLPEWYVQACQFEAVFVDLKVKPFAAFLNLFSSESYHVQRFISKDFENKLITILQQQSFDIVQLETLYLTPYISVIRKYSNAKIILRSHNVEHLIWERIAAGVKNPFKKYFLKHLAATLKNYEIAALNKYDGILAISNTDATTFRQLGCNIALACISFGVDLEKYSIDTNSQSADLFHIGAMNWIPNQEGIHWFLENVWPLIHQEMPDLKFYLAGRTMPKWLLNSDYPNVEILGEVEDAKLFIQSKGIMIVPLFSGSGLRIKMIEAMAMGKVVITTTIGAEGINIRNHENCMIADTIDEFKMAVIEMLQHHEKRTLIAHNARQLIEKEHDNVVLTDKLIAFYKQIRRKD